MSEENISSELQQKIAEQEQLKEQKVEEKPHR
jgi:hypothetical protein